MLIHRHNIVCIATIKGDQLPNIFKKALKDVTPQWVTPDGKEPFYPVSVFKDETDKQFSEGTTQVRKAILNLLESLDCDNIQIIE
ncbi:hypothetical protein [Mucilaginibacter sp. KACC 22063]|uniref:hypothetical protein n=1 Tax=Mucilaginibacter sp. KACC 22063 TaxID=3025666 RepID=UPI002366A672|nr:hypothetical protein [Mucilaginibacter sp. KACC 22063]WDF57206.1 hypothetical protein PQ461_09080 [Mucilaginibacter sp. KACC 22063]